MGKSKHTPGPWIAEPMVGRGAWVKGSNGTWAALSCGDSDLEAEANACLIAAVPDLLDALKEIVAADDTFRATMSPDVEKDPVTRACDAARAAIAKATGK
jgi:hypothetical protein